MAKKLDIKLIAIDLDGTLLDSNHSISEANRLAIAEAKRRDIQIVLCTGRPLRSMKHLLADIDLLDDEDLVVTYNGGLIQKSKTEEVLAKITFEKHEIIEIYELSQQLNCPLSLIDLDYIYEPPYPIGKQSIYGRNKIGVPQKNKIEILDIDMNDLPEPFAIQSVIISRPEEELNAIIQKIPPSYFEKYNIYKSHHHILEILPLNVDKGNSVNLIRNHLGVKKEEVMGIGDQENDLSLIQNTGFGVAMKNAVDTVKKAADYITKSNENDGVAHAINKFILK